MREITSVEFTNEVARSPGRTVVDFYSEGCGPCRLVSPFLEQIERENTGQVKVLKVDAANAPELVTQYNIQAVPTIMLFIDGQWRSQLVGARSKRDLQRWILETN
ncbi:MAG TPA: thioredoxin domain-containing protein [Verrucomicrobiae bacterium]|nr:thioredoxin domain-containing protein [Verrucomicrobiae bacterium]